MEIQDKALLTSSYLHKYKYKIVITAGNSLVNESGDIVISIVEILIHFIHILCKSSGSGYSNCFDFIHFVTLRISTENIWYIYIISYFSHFAMFSLIFSSWRIYVEQLNLSNKWGIEYCFPLDCDTCNHFCLLPYSESETLLDTI